MRGGVGLGRSLVVGKNMIYKLLLCHSDKHERLQKAALELTEFHH